jgi:hypothetical protein
MRFWRRADAFKPEQARFEEFFHEGAATDRIEAMRGQLGADE